MQARQVQAPPPRHRLEVWTGIRRRDRDRNPTIRADYAVVEIRNNKRER